MHTTTPLVETFTVEDGCLVRRVEQPRGSRYERRCPIRAYRELAWAAIDLAADGFTGQTLTSQVRNKPRERHDDSNPWVSYTNAVVAIAFWENCGLLDHRRHRNHVNDGYFFESAISEFYALTRKT